MVVLRMGRQKETRRKPQGRKSMGTIEDQGLLWDLRSSTRDPERRKAQTSAMPGQRTKIPRHISGKMGFVPSEKQQPNCSTRFLHAVQSRTDARNIQSILRRRTLGHLAQGKAKELAGVSTLDLWISTTRLLSAPLLKV